MITAGGAQLGAGARHYNLGGTNTTLIPVADATGQPYESGEVSGSLERTYFTVLLYDAGGAPVTNAGGTIQVQGRAGTDAHWQNISNGTFNAVDISDPARTQAAASGPLRQWRVLLAGTTVATQFSAYVDKYV
tara:strand:+ start:402 stop:800 length:399 start_codon:yes stop_codon:yes gene_type:complete